MTIGKTSRSWMIKPHVAWPSYIFGLKRLSDAICFLPEVSFLNQKWKSHLQPYKIEIRKVRNIVWFIFITGSDIFTN
jgi:hypothetical protein